MQQDTFWRENLFETDLESRGDYDLLFDQLADNDNSLRARVLNGANFYVRANNRTLTYFNSVADNLKHWYAADVAFMHHQCYTAVNGIKCDYMPFTIAHNWQWIYSDQSNPPYIIQLDCEMNYGTKLQTLASYGFNFTLADARTCNPIAVQTTRERMVNGTMDARLTQQSWGRLQFKAYYIISDLLIWFIPLTNPYGALMAYMLMITF
uniref:Nucleotide-diphospho-sugar transferase domain-containing protein n=1 Tax=Plectus sambesii TaxID=2011161 RepID=A0A914WM76_9BILA